MQAAIYSRVSSKVNSDGTCRQHVENQEPELLAVVASKGWELAAKYTDNDSGSKAVHNVGLQQMLADAQAHKFGALVIWSTDRLSREGIYETLGYVKTLWGLGIKVVSIQQPFLDSEGPTRELLLSIFAWIHTEERRILIERTKAGLRRAAASGTVLGAPRKITDLQCQQVRTLRDGGSSWSQVVKATHMPLANCQRAYRWYRPRAHRESGES
jgi:DNA invertase Pin-like site-specific DNA recombinase